MLPRAPGPLYPPPWLDLATELALEGGLPPPILLPPCDGRDISVELLGCCEDGGEVCGGRAVPLKAPGAKLGSVGVPPPIEPPGPPYREIKEESLLPVDNGEIGPPGPGLFITMQLSRRVATHVIVYT